MSGPADPGRYRIASIIDFAASVVLAMLAFPFPIVRASVAPPVFVALILVAIVVVHVLYLSVTVSVWGRTPGMYLLELGMTSGRTSPARALAWGFGAVLEFVPRAVGIPVGGAVGGLASRISGLEPGSTAGSGGTLA